jgi:hypothetical protein
LHVEASIAVCAVRESDVTVTAAPALASAYAVHQPTKTIDAADRAAR